MLRGPWYRKFNYAESQYEDENDHEQTLAFIQIAAIMRIIRLSQDCGRGPHFAIASKHVNPSSNICITFPVPLCD